MSPANGNGKLAPKNPVVFVVDDDEGMRSGVEFLLATAGFKVKAFSSAEAFLKYFDPSMRGA